MTTTDPRLETLEHSLTNHSPSPAAIEAIEAIRVAGKDLAYTLVNTTNPSREASLAATHLEETVMWAVKAVILQDADK